MSEIKFSTCADRTVGRYLQKATLKLPKVIHQILQALRMLCKEYYQISMVSAFSYGKAKMTGIQYVNLVPRELFPGSKWLTVNISFKVINPGLEKMESERNERQTAESRRLIRLLARNIFADGTIVKDY